MELQVLGPLRVRHDGRLIDLRPVERRLLSALSVCWPSSIRYDGLAEAVWGDDPPRSATHSLQAHVLRIRSVLGHDSIQTAAGGYQLAESVSMDSVAFEECARQASGTHGIEALTAWERALALWRGDPLGEVADWQPSAPVRARLIELRNVALEERCASALAVAPDVELVSDAEALVQAEPLREHRWALLMRALDAIGRRGEALRTYDRARRTLAAELGISPGRELTSLLDSLLSDDVDAKPSVTVSNLRLPPSSFVGREELMTELQRLVALTRVLTLVGPGGAGKTRLAQHLAAQLAPRYADGSWFVDLSPVTADAAAQTVASSLGLAVTGRLDTERLSAAVQDRDMLVVLDNADNCIDEVAAIAAALARAGTIVITTSRAPLAIDGEHVVPVGSLGARAADLFIDRALACRPDLDLSDQGEAIALLCERLDGLPLAVELAAARCASLAPAEVLARLDDHLSILTSNRRDTPDRHRTMWAAIGSAFETLDALERVVLQRLSVFADACTISAAEAVAGGDGVDLAVVAETLAALARRSLLTVLTGTPTRFRMLNTIRSFARDKLADSGQQQRSERAHTDWCLRFAAEAGNDLMGPGEAAAHARVEMMFDELRLAVTRAQHAGEVSTGLEIVSPVTPHTMYSLRLEILDWIEALVSMDDAFEHPLAARATATLALGRWLQGDLAAAQQWARLALEHGRGDHTTAAFANHVLGLLGQRELLAVAVAEADLAGNASTAVAFRAPLVLDVAASDPGAARDIAMDAFAAARRSGQPSALASAHWSLGVVLSRSDPARAIENFERCRVLATQIGNRMLPQIANMFSGMARAGIDARTAVSATLDAAEALDRDGSTLQAGMALARAAAAMDELGHRELAARLLGAALSTGLSSKPQVHQSLGTMRLVDEVQTSCPLDVEHGRNWTVRHAADVARQQLSQSAVPTADL